VKSKPLELFELAGKKLYVVFKILTLFSKNPEYLSTYVVGSNLTDLTDTT
jgi:hypothetical protein